MISRRAALWALAVIFAANFFNYIDRQLVSALEKPLSGYFGLTKAQYGLLWTLFTVGYMLCAPAIGFLADRFNRSRLFAACIVVWSLATVASGMARSQGVLYVARVLIGVGEAGCLIIGPSLISDYFAKEARGRALSIFYAGLPLGGTAAFIMAGVLDKIASWRELFYLAGVPGFLIAALIFLLRDPPRGGTEGAAHGMARGRMKDYLDLVKNRTLLFIIFAQTCAVTVLIPLIHFGAEFFTQARHMSDRDARIALGLIALISGVLGTMLSGVIGDRLARRFKGAYSALAGFGFLAGWPFLLVGFLSGRAWLFLPAIALGCFFYFLCMPAVNTQIANVTSPAQRATAWAMTVFIMHLLGDTISPPAFGKVVDYLSPSQGAAMARQHAFVYFSFALLVAGVLCLLAARTAAEDTERVARRVEQDAKV